MDYENEIDKNNIGLKESLKKIFKDVDKRLQQIDSGNSGETPTPDEEESGQLAPNQFIYNDTDYTVNLLECGVLKNGGNIAGTGVRFTITDNEDTIFSAETLGFSTRIGAAQFKDSDNNTITYKLYYNNELQSNAQALRPFNNQYEEIKPLGFSAGNAQETDTFKLEVIIADENNTTLTELAIECNNPT